MTGPEHYQEAERYLLAGKATGDNQNARLFTEMAAVHAQLAVAAATAWTLVDRYKGDSYLTNEWSDAIGWVIPAEIEVSP